MKNEIVSKSRVEGIISRLEGHKDVSKVLMLCLAGSHAYGTATESSDVDIRGVFVAKPSVVRTPFVTLKEMGIEGEEDGKVYELNTFMSLFCDMNPNILELGFVDEEATLYEHETWKYVKPVFPSLLNKNVAYRFSGYAVSQLQRIKGHNKQMNNPLPEKAPSQLEFMRLVQSYLPEKLLKHEDFMRELANREGLCTLVPFGGDIYGVVPDTRSCVGPMFNPDGSIRKLQYEDIPEEVKKRAPLFIIKYLSKEHNLAKDKHHNYWQWVKNRNPVRHEMEVKYGFDCKHGLHLVRLLRMAREILEDGHVLVKRPDAKELLAIRNGSRTYDELLEWAEKEDLEIRGKVMEESKLPKRSDLKLATGVILLVQDGVWSGE